jgi:hypothetical protein
VSTAAALSMDDWLAFVDWGGTPPYTTSLRLRNMLDLLYFYDREPVSSSCSSSASSSSGSMKMRSAAALKRV